MTEFNRDLQHAMALAEARIPGASAEEIADSDEVAEVLKRYTRPEPVSSPEGMDRAREWADRLLNAD